MLRPGQDQDRTTPKDMSDAQLPGPSQTSVKEAVQQVAAAMHGIEPQKGPANSTLGPIPTNEIQLHQVPVQALLDTGSPITIVFGLLPASNSQKQISWPVPHRMEQSHL